MSLIFLLLVVYSLCQIDPGTYTGMAYSEDGNITYDLQWNIVNYPTEKNATIGNYVLTWQPSGKCGGSITMYQSAEAVQQKEFGTTCMDDGIAYFYETSSPDLFTYMLCADKTFYPGYFQKQS